MVALDDPTSSETGKYAIALDHKDGAAFLGRLPPQPRQVGVAICSPGSRVAANRRSCSCSSTMADRRLGRSAGVESRTTTLLIFVSCALNEPLTASVRLSLGSIPCRFGL